MRSSDGWVVSTCFSPLTRLPHLLWKQILLCILLLFKWSCRFLGFVAHYPWIFTACVKSFSCRNVQLMLCGLKLGVVGWMWLFEIKCPFVFFFGRAQAVNYRSLSETPPAQLCFKGDHLGGSVLTGSRWGTVAKSHFDFVSLSDRDGIRERGWAETVRRKTDGKWKEKQAKWSHLSLTTPHQGLPTAPPPLFLIPILASIPLSPSNHRTSH